MYIRLIIFLVFAGMIIYGLVWYDLNRDEPWDSPVFFSENSINPTDLSIESFRSSNIRVQTAFG
jgi:hypothetical protein